MNKFIANIYDNFKFEVYILCSIRVNLFKELLPSVYRIKKSSLNY